MKRFFFISLFSILLAACGLAPASPTATSTPQPTATFTPTLSPTVTPTATEKPFAVPAAWKEILGDGFKVLGDGRVRDERTGNIIDGLRMNNKGQLQMFYEFEGDKNFGVTFEPKWDVKVTDEGYLDLPGWIWDGEKMVRQRYSRAEGYEGINMEYGEELWSVREVQAFLLDPKNVDMSDEARSISESRRNYIKICRESAKKSCLQPGLKENLGNPKLGQFTDWGWFYNKIAKKNNATEKYTEVDTTTFMISGLDRDPVTIISFYTADGGVRTILIDMDKIMPADDESDWTPDKPWSMERWSKAYKPLYFKK